MKRKQPTKSSPTFASPEMQQIEQLFQFMTEHNLEEFEYSRGDLHIRLRKPSSGLVLAAHQAPAPEIIVANPGGAAPAGKGASASGPEARLTEDLHVGKCANVGKFYGSRRFG